MGNFHFGQTEDRMKILKAIRASPCLHTLVMLKFMAFDFCGTEFMEVLAGILAESTSIKKFTNKYLSYQWKFSVQRTVQQRDSVFGEITNSGCIMIEGRKSYTHSTIAMARSICRF